MSRYSRHILLPLVIFLIPLSYSVAQNKILIMGLDTGQFYSNAFYLDELADMNGTQPEEVAKLYGLVLQQDLVNYQHDDFQYFSTSRKELDSVRLTSQFRTLSNAYGEEYLAMVPRSRDQSVLLGYIEKHDPDYILSINLYEILALDDSVKEGDDVVHVIHFDLFTKDLKTVNSGRYETQTNFYDTYGLDWFFMDMALEQIFWIQAYEKDPENMQEEYYDAIDRFYKSETSFEDMHAVSLMGGVGMPYGGIGIEYGKVFTESWEWGIGAGYDFSGLKFGLGFKYFVLGTSGTGPRPFIGFNLALATGNKFELGGETDEFGTQLDPDDVSTFKIFGDQAIYLRFGLNFLAESDLAISPTIGYAFPFSRKEPDLLSGPDKKGRTNFVQFMAVGGLEIGITITGYFK